MVEDLIEKGADVNWVDYFAPFSPLMCAVTSKSESNIEIVRLLLEHNVDVNYRKEMYDANALYQIMISNETIPNASTMVDLLVENGSDIYYNHKTYGSLLNVACSHHNGEMILHLLKNYEFDPNSTFDGDTALIYYCRGRFARANAEDVKALLEYGADKSIVNDEGKTAYDYAVENGFEEIVELLK
jgi:ankyrin repeat protein